MFKRTARIFFSFVTEMSILDPKSLILAARGIVSVRNATTEKCRPVQIAVASSVVVNRIRCKSSRLKSAHGDADIY